jgi:hypothetical protein
MTEAEYLELSALSVEYHLGLADTLRLAVAELRDASDQEVITAGSNSAAQADSFQTRQHSFEGRASRRRRVTPAARGARPSSFGE